MVFKVSLLFSRIFFWFSRFLFGFHFFFGFQGFCLVFKLFFGFQGFCLVWFLCVFLVVVLRLVIQKTVTPKLVNYVDGCWSKPDTPSALSHSLRFLIWTL